MKLLPAEVKIKDGQKGATLRFYIHSRVYTQKLLTPPHTRGKFLPLSVWINHFSQYTSLRVTSNTQSRRKISIALSISSLLCSLPQHIRLFIPFLLFHLSLINPTPSLSSSILSSLSYSHISELFLQHPHRHSFFFLFLHNFNESHFYIFSRACGYRRSNIFE